MLTLAMAVCSVDAAVAKGPTEGKSSKNVNSGRGLYGADLNLLAKFYTPPQSPGESNHYIDMWAGRTTRDYLVAHGLTNNHALVINSHGGALPYGLSARHAYYPHDSLLPRHQKTPYFSVQDLARLLGPENAKQIHNIVLAGCDPDRSFDSQELRKHFINATNITHTVAGEMGYQSMFLQALFSDSADIRPLYESAKRNPQGKMEYHLNKAPAGNAVKLTPYLAELFRPGETKPFRTQVAGRELLEPPQTPWTASIGQNNPTASNTN